MKSVGEDGPDIGERKRTFIEEVCQGTRHEGKYKHKLLLLVTKDFNQRDAGTAEKLEDLSLALGVVRLDVLVGDDDFEGLVPRPINLRGDTFRDGGAVGVGTDANTFFRVLKEVSLSV